MAAQPHQHDLPENALLARDAFERGQAEAAAGHRAAACRWLDRAARLVPRDDTIAFALAMACLGQDDGRAARLFARLSATHDVREAWLGLAGARGRLGDAQGAAGALAEALARHIADQSLSALASDIAHRAESAGWCALGSDGSVIVEAVVANTPVTCSLDRRPVRIVDGNLPQRWRAARELSVVTADGRHLLGSPIDIQSITRVSGCVTSEDGGLSGWAWMPGQPDTDPQLTIESAATGKRLLLIADDQSVPMSNGGLLARPRGFQVSAARLGAMPGMLHIRGSDGRDLLGSPLDPGAERYAAASAVMALARLYPAKPRSGAGRSDPAPPAAIPVAHVSPHTRSSAVPARRRVDVVIPVYGGRLQTLACIDSVLADLAAPNRLIVVDDASQDPELAETLDLLAARRRIRLLRNAANLGFPASANRGMQAAAGHDVILLNSDTIVPPGWLTDLQDIAYSAADIGTVTPFSNDATILSYPSPSARNPVPNRQEALRLGRQARQANRGVVVDIPVAVGFCTYIRRDCLDQVGLLRADIFAQGYGEENDFCLRARHLGWRHVAAAGVFVAHIGSHSFADAAKHLKARNAAVLGKLHPGYEALIQDFVTSDPLAKARRRFDLVRWRGTAKQSAESIILISHAEGGGVERQIAASIARHQAAGRRAIVLRPERLNDGSKAVQVHDGLGAAFPNLRFALPGELSALQRLLARTRPSGIELHHLVGHHAGIVDLIDALALPYDVFVHDYAWLCGRIALVGPSGRYCGEPRVVQCESCVADAGNLVGEDISVTDLRARSARLFASARQVIVPSHDSAARIARHFPGIAPRVVTHEDDAALPEPDPPISTNGHCRICVIGSIGIHKGYQVLLDCARDAAQRDLPLDFVVVGHTIDDARLLATGRAFVTGTYTPDEVDTLIRAQQATYALLPSIFPETWCLGIAEAWRAGLNVIAFDIGAQAERIRHSGRGFLLPLGLPTEAINDALIVAAGLSVHGSVC